LRKQQTVAARVVLGGTGLHAGEMCRATVCPADEDSGVAFVVGGETIPAAVDYVVGTARSTMLGKGDVCVRSVEHILAALAGLCVDNAEILVEGTEIPAFDGSALPICQAIRSAGIIGQSKPVDQVRIAAPVIVESGGGFIAALPADAYRLRYFLSYHHPMIGVQSAECVLGNNCFSEKVAPARTFVLYEEVEELRDSSLARGGSLENTIVIWPDKTSTDYRMPQELAVHKLLDLVGDLSLVGRPLLAEVIAVKSGHGLNVALARKILSGG